MYSADADTTPHAGTIIFNLLVLRCLSQVYIPQTRQMEEVRRSQTGEACNSRTMRGCELQTSSVSAKKYNIPPVLYGRLHQSARRLMSCYFNTSRGKANP
jgi:hypothetical protein